VTLNTFFRGSKFMSCVHEYPFVGLSISTAHDIWSAYLHLFPRYESYDWHN